MQLCLTMLSRPNHAAALNAYFHTAGNCRPVHGGELAHKAMNGFRTNSGAEFNPLRVPLVR